MRKGISLHIGLNRVDPKQYAGWSGDLAGCEFDANDMIALARKQGFKPTARLLTKEATSAAVVGAISEAAKRLAGGDIFFLSYSGHGGQVKDTNGDETDGYDETWVLYDRMLLDDELYALWTRFKKGVRIVVLSDSCHSGTVLRAAPPCIDGRPAQRFMLREVGMRVYRAHKRLYDGLQRNTPPSEATSVNASVLLISGCMDNQTSSDGDRNGLFTQTLKQVWNGGTFKGTYRTFRNRIVAAMPDMQTPNYYLAGSANPSFEAEKPFSI